MWGVGTVRLTPDLLACSSISEAAFFGAIDLYDDTVLDDNVHRSEPQAAERIAYLIERIIVRGSLLGGRSLRRMENWVRHDHSSIYHFESFQIS